MSEKRFLVIAIPPGRSVEEQSLPRQVSERKPERPVESKETDKAETPTEKRWTRVDCESMKNPRSKRRL